MTLAVARDVKRPTLNFVMLASGGKQCILVSEYQDTTEQLATFLPSVEIRNETQSLRGLLYSTYLRIQLSTGQKGIQHDMTHL